MIKNNNSDDIKNEIKQRSENYLKNLKKVHKKELEILKENPYKNISSTGSFVGYSYQLLDKNAFFAALDKELNEKEKVEQDIEKPAMTK